jgi:hypothetical protein
MTNTPQYDPTTAAMRFRFAPPKFLLHCVPQKLHIAAERAKVSSTTIRNWIKTDYLHQTGKGLVSKTSFDDFFAEYSRK